MSKWREEIMVVAVVALSQGMEWWWIKSGWLFAINRGFWGVHLPATVGLILTVGALYFTWVWSRGVVKGERVWYDLMMGGIGSNLVSRVMHTGVVDYWNGGWFAFNIADIFIIVGVGMVIEGFIKKEKGSGKDETGFGKTREEYTSVG